MLQKIKMTFFSFKYSASLKKKYILKKIKGIRIITVTKNTNLNGATNVDVISVAIIWAFGGRIFCNGSARLLYIFFEKGAKHIKIIIKNKII